jgi:hypothetical protein
MAASSLRCADVLTRPASAPGGFKLAAATNATATAAGDVTVPEVPKFGGFQFGACATRGAGWAAGRAGVGVRGWGGAGVGGGIT